MGGKASAAKLTLAQLRERGRKMNDARLAKAKIRAEIMKELGMDAVIEQKLKERGL